MKLLTAGMAIKIVFVLNGEEESNIADRVVVGFSSFIECLHRWIKIK